MSGALDHVPSKIIRQLLFDLGHGTDPDDDADWPIRYSFEPDEPANHITLFDTEPRQFGRSQPDGITQEHYGLQVRVRSETKQVGWRKAQDIAKSFDEDVLRDEVILGDYTYVVQSTNRQGGVRDLGVEAGTSRRRVHTMDILTDIFLLEAVGTGL